PGLEVHLEIEHEIELARRELSAHVGECAPALRSIEEHDVINMLVAPHERRWSWLQHPGDMRVRRMAIKRVKHGKHVHRVADGAHHHDTDAIEQNRLHPSASTSRRMSSTVSPAGDGRASIRAGPMPCGKV